MKFLSTDLWDDHPNLVRGIEPLFANFGDEVCFGGEIVTVKKWLAHRFRARSR